MVWQDVVPWIFSLGMFVLTLITVSRNGKKDLRQEYTEELTKIHEIEQSLTRICTKLDNLQNTMQETRADVKAMSSGIQALDKRVSVLETSMESAWIRIDELKDKVGHYHEGH